MHECVGGCAVWVCVGVCVCVRCVWGGNGRIPGVLRWPGTTQLELSLNRAFIVPKQNG